MMGLHKNLVLVMLVLATGCRKTPVKPIPATVRTPEVQGVEVGTERSAVIKLRVQRDAGSSETAAGLFVGKDPRQAYFVTARHALQQDPENAGSSLVQSVELFFPGGAQATASVSQHSDEAMDLGVIQIPVAQLPSAVPKVAHAEVTPADAIVIVGHPAAGSWSSWNGIIQNINCGKDTSCFITSKDLSLAGGYSGGPVFDACGNFIGMHQRTTDSYGFGLKSSAILEKLRTWDVPTENLAAERNAGTADPQRDREAILSAIDQYASAYESLDPEAVWKLWPAPQPQTKQNIARAFGAARSISMKISAPNVALVGTTATATAQYSQEYRPRSGGPMRSNGSITFKLRKSCRMWVIDSIS